MENFFIKNNISRIEELIGLYKKLSTISYQENQQKCTCDFFD